jgi:hypothetical protein
MPQKLLRRVLMLFKVQVKRIVFDVIGTVKNPIASFNSELHLSSRVMFEKIVLHEVAPNYRGLR